MYLSHGCPNPLQHFLLARAEDLVEDSILLDRVVKENTSTRMKKKKKGAAYIPLFQSSRGIVCCGSRDLGSGSKFSVVCSESVFTELSPFIHNLSGTVPDTADAANTTSTAPAILALLLGLW